MFIIGKMTGKKDQTGTGGKHRQPRLDFLFQRFKHFQFSKKFSLNRTLTSWKNQSVEITVKVFFFPQFDTSGTQFFQLALMFCKSSLYSKDSDFHLIYPSLPSEAGFPAH